MRRSTDRILVSHAGTVPRPADLQELFRAGDSRRAEFLARLPGAVKEVVDRQVQAGIDIVNDGEISKSNYTQYARSRLGGL
jgi:5-methyltetrahydropteroyltriglutamate--homocysteine methyltransferase